MICLVRASASLVSLAFICPKCPDDALDLLFKLSVVPFPAGEVSGQPAADLGTVATLPAIGKDVAIQVQRDKCMDLLAALPCQLVFLL